MHSTPPLHPSLPITHLFAIMHHNNSIPNASSKTSTKERKVAQTAVTEDRRHAIEANIVRIMKSRKTLTHQQLVCHLTYPYYYSHSHGK
jgi:hypothetical protein